MGNTNRSMSIHTKALIAVLLGNAIFGFSFLFSKLALQITLPSVLIAVRFTTAFVVLNIVVLIGKSVKKKDGTSLIQFSLKGKPFKYVLILALFQPIIYFIAENYGILYTSSAYSGAIIAVIPIAGIVFDVIIMRSKVRPIQIICAIASIVGVVITTMDAQDMSASLKGTVLLLVAVCSSALFYVFSKKSSADFSAVERTYVMFGLGSIFYIVLALIQCRGAYDVYIIPALIHPTFWISILYLAVVSSVMAFLFLNFGSGYVSVSKCALFANFTTVISILAGVLILHESFSWKQVAGAAIILIAVYLASRVDK